MGKLKTKLKIKSTYVGANGRIRKVVKSGSKIAAEGEEMLRRRAQELHALPSDIRRAIAREVEHNGAPPDDLTGMPMEVEEMYGGGGEWVYEDDSDGEAPEISHEGGEFADRLRSAFELTNAARGRQKYSRPWDTRGRRERIKALQRNWEAEMPALVDAYMQRKYGAQTRASCGPAACDGGGGEGPEAGQARHEGSTNRQPSEGRAEGATQQSAAAELGGEQDREGSVHAEGGGAHMFNICAIRTFERIPGMSVMQHDNESANVALIRAGFLGCAPQQPSFAFELHTLELYHRLRRRHSGLGLLPMARALCDLHDVEYRASFREQLSIAFDAYLEILRQVKRLVDVAVGRGDPLWQIKNSCPACSYKLKDEPPLVPSRLGCIDGNNSAKRVASAGTEDERDLASSYFLSREEVNIYKDEVKGRRIPSAVDLAVEVEDAPWAPDPDSPGDPTDGEDSGVTSCTERWKASAAEHTKKALDVYDITGIFGGSCRHGLITLFCEMVQSGELAKYPLAIVDHQLDAHDDDDEASVFDIGCAFKKTVSSSPLVGPKAARRRLQIFVNAFHGWAHNRLCQLSNHPLYRSGVGIEDMEGMERVFSASNAVARVVRYASRFHWKQALDLHFQQWDDDKYVNLSRFLLNNYRQALAIIQENSQDVLDMLVRLNIDEAVVQGWLAEEEKFLQELKEEPEERILDCAYVEALIARHTADQKWDSTSRIFVETPSTQSAQGTQAYRNDMRRTARLEAARRNASIQLEVANRAVEDLEHKLSIEKPWTPEDDKYKEALDYLQKRDFHKALNKVQQLVVQRLFEMSKANIAGMGYKVRTSIWKHIRSRSKAIRTALAKYNDVAAKMRPRAPALDWKDIVNFSFVSEFDVLRHSHAGIDITAKPWMSPLNRAVANKLFKTMRAREEIVRLNVEVRRLRTFIFSEDTAYLDAMAIQEQCGNNLLAAEIEARYQSRHRVNMTHHAVLDTIEQLPGYTGTPGGGSPTDGSAVEFWEDTDEMVDVGAVGGLEDADLQDQCIRMTELMEDLVLDS